MIPTGYEMISTAKPKKLVNCKYVMYSRLLGSGACSNVYLGLTKAEKTPVSIKKIRKSDKIAFAYARNEVKMLKKVHHPFIIRVLGLHETRHNIYIIEEYLPMDFYKFLESHGPLTESFAKHVFYQIFEVVRYLHSVGVCHCDLKPENFMIQHHHIRLIDFGFACNVDAPPDQVGTLVYMAPELFAENNEGFISFKDCDSWSVGIMLFLALLGYAPYEHPSEASDEFIKNALLKEDILSSQGKQVITSLLLLNASNRATVQSCLAHEWLQGVAHGREDEFCLYF